MRNINHQLELLPSPVLPGYCRVFINTWRQTTGYEKYLAYTRCHFRQNVEVALLLNPLLSEPYSVRSWIESHLSPFPEGTSIRKHMAGPDHWSSISAAALTLLQGWGWGLFIREFRRSIFPQWYFLLNPCNQQGESMSLTVFIEINISWEWAGWKAHGMHLPQVYIFVYKPPQHLVP